jgi:adenylate cyclase
MIEIERKFLVKPGRWPQGQRKVVMRQAYLAQQDNTVCRVRQKDSNFFLSIKTRIDDTHSYDYEYPIPVEDGQVMLDKISTRSAISKTRHEVTIDGKLWEIDEFHAENHGLVVAEIELSSADEQVTLPDWLDTEVTNDRRYTNAALYFKPWLTW